ncbi:MAG TPA: NAD(P)H-quinone oxidoreductase [Candidatus Cybelea sp.]
MQYVAFERYGSPEVLHVAEMPPPKPAPGEVLVAVEAAGISRADVMQRQGNYPPPRDASPILGLEVAGSVASVGASVSRWKAGDRVCALTNGGGYAEFVAVPQGQVLPIPQGWSAVEAATLPENAFTVYDNLVTRSRLERGESVLVHGGTSGIGSTAIMFALAFGATPYATAGGAEKVEACLRLGAKAAIDYRTSDFVAEIARLTSGAGVNVVLDIVGGDYVARDIECLSPDGRVVCIATQRGRNVEIDLHRLLAKRATIMGSSLRPRTAEQKAAIARELERHIWPLLPKRDPIVPVVDAVFPFARAAEAHARMEGSAHIGKLVLTPNGAS